MNAGRRLRSLGRVLLFLLVVVVVYSALSVAFILVFGLFGIVSEEPSFPLGLAYLVAYLVSLSLAALFAWRLVLRKRSRPSTEEEPPAAEPAAEKASPPRHEALISTLQGFSLVRHVGRGAAGLVRALVGIGGTLVEIGGLALFLVVLTYGVNLGLAGALFFFFSNPPYSEQVAALLLAGVVVWLFQRLERTAKERPAPSLQERLEQRSVQRRRLLSWGLALLALLALVPLGYYPMRLTDFNNGTRMYWADSRDPFPGDDRGAPLDLPSSFTKLVPVTEPRFVPVSWGRLAADADFYNDKDVWLLGYVAYYREWEDPDVPVRGSTAFLWLPDSEYEHEGVFISDSSIPEEGLVKGEVVAVRGSFRAEWAENYSTFPEWAQKGATFRVFAEDVVPLTPADLDQLASQK